MRRKKNDILNTAAIRPAYWMRGRSIVKYLGHLYAEISRVGDIGDVLHPQQWALLIDLRDDEMVDHCEAFYELHNIALWNLEVLAQRGEEYRQRYDVYLPEDVPFYTKPRIDITSEITSQGNLSVTWKPTGWGKGRQNRSDWAYWFESVRRRFDRPRNELLFLHNVENLRCEDLTHLSPRRRNIVAIDATLICAVRAKVDALLQRLSVTFDVTRTHDFDFVLAEKGDDPFKAGYVLSWQIFDVEARRRQRAETWLSEFEQSYGLTVQAFLQVYRDCTTAPRRKHTHRRDEYSSSDLKKLGCSITPREVRCIIVRLKADFPEVLINAGMGMYLGGSRVVPLVQPIVGLD